jgi:hypothetical protein
MKVHIENSSKSFILIDLHDTDVSNRYFKFLEAQDLGGWFLTKTGFIYFGKRDKFSTTNDPILAMDLDKRAIYPISEQHEWETYRYFRKVLEDVKIKFSICFEL